MEGSLYPVVDSVQNLRISVSVQRVISGIAGNLPSFSSFIGGRQLSSVPSSSALSPLPQTSTQEHSEQLTIKWQQKIFSAREFQVFSDAANCKTPTQRLYHEEILELKNQGHIPGRLFTYIDGDEYFDAENELQNLSLEEDSSQEPGLGDRMINARRRKIAPQGSGTGSVWQNPVVDIPTADAIQKNHSLAQSSQIMHIMADLGPREGDPTKEADEKLLCTICLTNDSQIWIQPDFTFTKRAYKVEGRLGVFQYTIVNQSVKSTVESKEAIKKKDAKMMTYKENLLQNRIGMDFDVPEDGVLKIVFLGEIVSAQNFEYDYLSVHYLVELPKGWYAADPKSLEGVTPSTKSKILDGDYVQYFSYPFEVTLCYGMSLYSTLDEDSVGGWPHILLEVVSTDTWNRHRTEGYACATLPTHPGTNKVVVNTWRPAHISPAAELRRFFVGGTPELESLDITRVPNGFEGNKLSKLGISTISSGQVKLQFRSIHQCRSFISGERQRQLRYGAILRKIGITGLQPGILGVLEAFQKARARMLAARDNLYHVKETVGDNDYVTAF